MLGAERTAESYVRKSKKELIAELQALHNELSLLKKYGGAEIRMERIRRKVSRPSAS